ncbi:MAG TPA: hypothetical protein DCZ95_09605 [Verrucomicrobia bacterium]|nr:MAG: hypothetical protein A2X46_10485 [Lentisphaerae bacterium GWF2_57_35]HBA84335.1 hypothetical protein [Verrucomicrobiota bacterium]
MESWKNQKSRTLSEPVSILLPVCNEAEGIESIIAEFVEVVYRHVPEGSEFLINEGGSTDGTKEILRELNKRWPFLNIDYKEKKEGFAKAAIQLYRRSSCPLLFFADSDGQCVASEFWKLAGLIQDHDFVLGVKKIHYDPFVRRVASRNFNAISRLLFGFQFRDINFGFRLSRREALLKTLDRAHYMPTLLNAELTILAYCMGYRLCEIQVHHRPRIYGMSRGLVPNSVPSESWRAFKALIGLWREASRLKAAAAQRTGS